MGANGREEGKGGSKGWAIDHQPGMSMDWHLHNDYQKGDFQVSKKGWFIIQRRGSGHKGEHGGNWSTEQYSPSAVRVCIVVTCIHI